jgi:competence protein ComEC
MKTKFIILTALCLFTSSLCWSATPEKTLDIYWVDVEGGAATLIVTPEGESVLIDTGIPGGRDSGRIYKVAKEAGLKKIDHLIITHFHIDHFGGAAELSELIPIGTLYDNGIPERDPDHNSNDTRFPLLIKPYREMRVGKRTIIKADDVIPLRQSKNSAKLGLRCLAAKQIFTKQVPKDSSTNSLCAESNLHDKDTSDNANSVVTLLEFGGFRFFDGGDLTWNIEGQLVCPINLVGRVDVYQVDHHGLDMSNNPLLVRSLSPTVTVMSNGTSKGCDPATFATLKSAPSIKAMYQIHKNLRADPVNNTDEDHIANLEEHCASNHIKLSVMPDGKNYTVSIPAKGHAANYATVSSRHN